MCLRILSVICIVFCIVSESSEEAPKVEVIIGPEAFIHHPTEGKLRVIRTTNELDKNVFVQCRDKNNAMDTIHLKPGDCYKLSFDRNWLGFTHFWCNVWFNGAGDAPTHYPVYNEGAPNDNNIFVIKEDGIYMKDMETLKFKLFRERKA